MTSQDEAQRLLVSRRDQGLKRLHLELEVGRLSALRIQLVSVDLDLRKP